MYAKQKKSKPDIEPWRRYETSIPHQATLPIILYYTTSSLSLSFQPILQQ